MISPDRKIKILTFKSKMADKVTRASNADRSVFRTLLVKLLRFSPANVFYTVPPIPEQKDAARDNHVIPCVRELSQVMFM